MTESTAPEVPESSSSHASVTPTAAVITIGQQIAGGLLIVNAIFILLSAGLIPADPKLGPLFAPARSIMPALIDVLIGASLLSKKTKYISWAILRVVLGTALFTALSITKDPMMAASQIMIGGALLLLLLGDAGRPRLVAGAAMFFLYALLNVAGLSATALGVNPLGPVIQMAIGDIEPGTVSVVTGNASHYRVKTPSSHWYLRTAKAAKKNNELSDRWLTRPDLDAHVLIIAETEPGKQLSADLLADAVVENAKRVSVDFEVISREPIKRLPKAGRIIHTRSMVDNLALENLNGAIAVYEHGYQIIAFAPRVSFPKVEAELRSIIESFELPTDVKPGLPDDAEPGNVSTVKGQLQSYLLTAPDGNWYLRKEAMAKKDNSLADRWIIRPDLDAHIMVIAELVEGADLDPDHYASAVADALHANSGATIVSREPVTSDPQHGRILYATATVNGLPIAYSYGCFARGEQAFQVVAFAHQDHYPEVKEAFRKAIETFQLPPPRKLRK